MQSEILKRIAEDIKISKEDGEGERIIFGKRGYSSDVIDKKNFEKIEQGKSNKKIAFIDGGNSEIVGSTNFSLQLIRSYCCIFERDRKTDEVKNEFFALCDSAVKNEDVIYNVKIYPLSGDFKIDNFSIDSMDKNIVEGGRMAKIAKAGEIARRFSEIRLAEEIVENDRADIIVFDGTLECTAGEKEKLDRVYENSLIKDKVVCALAKTTNLFTDKGKNALVYINGLGGSGSWLYNKVAEIDDDGHKAEIFIAKMNDKSEHCFRFEIFKMQKDRTKEVVGCLTSNSRDISFPGYPYGMILADKNARISNKETDYLKSLFFAKARDAKAIAKEMTSNDSHAILDSVN